MPDLVSAHDHATATWSQGKSSHIKSDITDITLGTVSHTCAQFCPVLHGFAQFHTVWHIFTDLCKINV